MVDFREAIASNAPHIYLSALPFTTQSSRIAKQFRPIFPNTLHNETTALKTWNHLVIPNEANTIGFLPDGQRVVSSSWGKKIRIWDAVTGKEQVTMRGHDDSVRSVTLSPDAQRAGTGSNYFRVHKWNIKTDGWMHTPQNQRCFWVPPLHRRGAQLLDPGALDMRRVVHGANWHTCFQAS